MWNYLDEFDRFMREFRSSLEELVHTIRPWSKQLPEAESREPAVDLRDTGDELVLTAELPGVSKEDIELNVSERSVEIRGESKTEREEEAGEYHLRERGYRSLYRRLTLPEEVEADKVEATYRDGVLEVRMPKKRPTAPPKGRRVEIK
jgi:HSP20 family protein